VGSKCHAVSILAAEQCVIKAVQLERNREGRIVMILARCLGSTRVRAVAVMYVWGMWYWVHDNSQSIISAAARNPRQAAAASAVHPGMHEHTMLHALVGCLLQLP
jgi:hypothetical protein